MKRLVTIALATALGLTVLAGCSSSEVSFTWSPGQAKATLNNLDGEAEGRYDLAWQDMEFEVQLEKGSVDIEIVDALLSDESPVPDEFGTLYEGDRLVNGDSGTFSDPDGSFILRLEGHDATGVINIKQR